MIALKMAQAGWANEDITTAVQVSGFRKTTLEKNALSDYAGKISVQAIHAASHAKDQAATRGVSHGRALEL